jgi:ankyrin repeat protein
MAKKISGVARKRNGRAKEIPAKRTGKTSKKGAKLNSLLIDASLDGDLSRIRRLLRQGADVNFRNGVGMTALSLSAWKGYTEACRLLVESGADPNWKDIHGETALHMAELSMHRETIEYLRSLNE